MSSGERRQRNIRRGDRRSGRPDPSYTGPERRKGPTRRGDRRQRKDNDLGKGAVESDQPGAPDQVSMSGQLPHRAGAEGAKGKDSDFPEPGQNPEHSGQRGSVPQKEGKR
jgi:hypothetical protein